MIAVRPRVRAAASASCARAMGGNARAPAGSLARATDARDRGVDERIVRKARWSRSRQSLGGELNTRARLWRLAHRAEREGCGGDDARGGVARALRRRRDPRCAECDALMALCASTDVTTEFLAGKFSFLHALRYEFRV